MSAQLKSTSQGQTMILTLSNPSLRNALGPEMYAAGVEALNIAEGNPEVRAVVITGEGAHFCAGANLHHWLDTRELATQDPARDIEALNNWMETIRTFPKPVIAAVEGVAAGAGFSMALMCDLIVAAHDSLFEMNHSRMGLTPDAGASWSLARALPRQLASELLLLGERIDPQRLQALGMVNRVVDSGTTLEHALQLAERLHAQAANVTSSTKELINDAAEHTLTQQLAQERDQLVRQLHHVNGGIGLRAFLDNTTPHYK